MRKGIDHVPHTPGKTEVAINPINPASLAEAAPHLSTEEANRIQGGDKDFQADTHLLRALAEARVPAEKRVFGIGHYLRPHGVQFIDCTGVLCAGYQLNHPPFWQHNPVGCRDLHAKGVFTWPEWAAALAQQIAGAQAAGDADLGDTYYHHWLATLEQLVARKGASNEAELARYRDAWHSAAHRTPHGKAIELREQDFAGAPR